MDMASVVILTLIGVLRLDAFNTFLNLYKLVNTLQKVYL